MKILFSAKTDTGRVRRENQDSYGISEARKIYFLCDGMGGGAAGDFASRFAAELILKAVDMLKKDEIHQIARKASETLAQEIVLVIAAIRLANRALSNLANEYSKLSGMGTTFTGVYFDPSLKVVHIFHVGDSRGYRLRKGILEPLTRDHSKVNELLDLGKMKANEIKTAEIQSMITRALGTAPRVKIDCRTEYFRDDDCYLLCTDGLNGEIEDYDIESIVVENKSNLDVMTSKLIAAANEAGGRDNTTVIGLKVNTDSSDNALTNDAHPGKVITIDEETQEETKAEDKILKRLINDAKITIPKSIRKNSVIENPIVLGAILALFVATLGLFAPKCSRQDEHGSRLTDLAGKVTGVRVEIRQPIPEQYKIFKTCEDKVTRMQIVQDWYGKSGQYTTPLKNAQISISDGKREQFRGITTEDPMEVKLESGSYVIRPSYFGYYLVTDKTVRKESYDIVIEPSENYMAVILIMIPQE